MWLFLAILLKVTIFGQNVLASLCKRAIITILAKNVILRRILEFLNTAPQFAIGLFYGFFNLLYAVIIIINFTDLISCAVRIYQIILTFQSFENSWAKPNLELVYFFFCNKD